MPSRTSLATSIVAVLVEEAAAALGALRDALAVLVGVDLDLADVALELALVLDGPANNVDIDRLVREAIEASKHADPLVVLLPERGLDLGALRSSDGCVALPADAIVDLALAGDDLVVAVVLEAERVGVGLDLVLPDLVEAGLEVGRRVPGLLRKVTLRRGGVGPGVGVVEGEGLGLESANRGGSAALDVRVHVTGDGASKGAGDKGGNGECGLHLERVWLVCVLIIRSSRRTNGAGTRNMNEWIDSTEESNNE